MLPHFMAQVGTRHRSQEPKRRIRKMLITKKMLLALTLVGALLGAGIGALVTHSASNTGAAKANNDTTQTANSTWKTPDQLAAANNSQLKTPQNETAKPRGFADGFSTLGTTGNLLES